MSKENIAVGLEIGTSKVCVAVADMRPDGTLEVLGVGQAPSAGVRKGEIVRSRERPQKRTRRARRRRTKKRRRYSQRLCRHYRRPHQQLQQSRRGGTARGPRRDRRRGSGRRETQRARSEHPRAERVPARDHPALLRRWAGWGPDSRRYARATNWKPITTSFTASGRACRIRSAASRTCLWKSKTWCSIRWPARRSSSARIRKTSACW